MSLNANERNAKQCTDIDSKPSHEIVIEASQPSMLSSPSPAKQSIRMIMQSIKSYTRDTVATPPRESLDAIDIFSTPPPRQPRSRCSPVTRCEPLSPEMLALLEAFSHM